MPEDLLLSKKELQNLGLNPDDLYTPRVVTLLTAQGNKAYDLGHAAGVAETNIKWRDEASTCENCQVKIVAWGSELPDNKAGLALADAECDIALCGYCILVDMHDQVFSTAETLAKLKVLEARHTALVEAVVAVDHDQNCGEYRDCLCDCNLQAISEAAAY